MLARDPPRPRFYNNKIHGRYTLSFLKLKAHPHHCIESFTKFIFRTASPQLAARENRLVQSLDSRRPLRDFLLPISLWKEATQRPTSP